MNVWLWWDSWRRIYTLHLELRVEEGFSTPRTWCVHHRLKITGTSSLEFIGINSLRSLSSSVLKGVRVSCFLPKPVCSWGLSTSDVLLRSKFKGRPFPNRRTKRSLRDTETGDRLVIYPQMYPLLFTEDRICPTSLERYGRKVPTRSLLKWEC